MRFEQHSSILINSHNNNIEHGHAVLEMPDTSSAVVSGVRALYGSEPFLPVYRQDPTVLDSVVDHTVDLKDIRCHVEETEKKAIRT